MRIVSVKIASVEISNMALTCEKGVKGVKNASCIKSLVTALIMLLMYCMLFYELNSAVQAFLIVFVLGNASLL